MKKVYVAPQVEDVRLSELMQQFGIAGTSPVNNGFGE